MRNKRIYRLIVATEVSMITLLLLFVFSGEQILERIRGGNIVATSYRADQSWDTAEAYDLSASRFSR
jgi:hypothetical protein